MVPRRQCQAVVLSVAKVDGFFNAVAVQQRKGRPEPLRAVPSLPGRFNFLLEKAVPDKDTRRPGEAVQASENEVVSAASARHRTRV